MSETTESSADPKLIAVAETINDLDDLVRLILMGPTRTISRQRQLAARLGDVDRLMQVLRLTIVLEKADARIVAAAEDPAGSCRQQSGLPVPAGGRAGQRHWQKAARRFHRAAVWGRIRRLLPG